MKTPHPVLPYIKGEYQLRAKLSEIVLLKHTTKIYLKVNNEDGEIQEKRIKNYGNEETKSGGDEKSDDNSEKDIIREENIASSSKYRYFFFKICIVVFDCTF